MIEHTPIVASDKFEPEEVGHFDVPCCWCKHRHRLALEEPCRTCDHNLSAEPDAPTNEHKEQ